MKIKTIAPLFLLLICSNFVYSQTMADFKRTYGEPPGFVPSFKIADGIWLWVYFGKDEQVCRAVLYSKNESASPEEQAKKLYFENFAALVEQIVPEYMRGAKKEPFSRGGVTIAGGRSSWATFTYENVTLVYSQFLTGDSGWSFLKLGRRSKRLSADAAMNYTEQPDSPRSKAMDDIAPSESKDDFTAYKSSLIDRVQIDWNGRTCREY